jgi:RNA methyltransferase, TrmH family
VRRSGGSEITSLRNPAVQAARKLSRRAGDGRFLLEGVRGIHDALDAGVRLDTIFVTPAAEATYGDLVETAARAGSRVLTVSDQVLAGVADTVTPQGLVAIAGDVTLPLAALPPAPRLVCVLDQARDPGNVGTVVRAADAAGADAVVTTAGSTDPQHPKAVRAAAGSLFHLPVFAGAPWPALRDALRARGLLLVGADPHARTSSDDAPLDRACALVLGNEAHGLDPAVRADLDLTVRLPVPGRAESLNLAAAAAILLYVTARRQAAAHGGMPGAAGHDESADQSTGSEDGANG